MAHLTLYSGKDGSPSIPHHVWGEKMIKNICRMILCYHYHNCPNREKIIKSKIGHTALNGAPSPFGILALFAIFVILAPKLALSQVKEE